METAASDRHVIKIIVTFSEASVSVSAIRATHSSLSDTSTYQNLTQCHQQSHNAMGHIS